MTEKYFMEDMLKKNHFIEISEDLFDDIVVRFREQFTMKREFTKECYKRIFTEKETGLRYIIERK